MSPLPRPRLQVRQLDPGSDALELLFPPQPPAQFLCSETKETLALMGLNLLSCLYRWATGGRAHRVLLLLSSVSARVLSES